jgi:pyrimidine deaminase RibD-like protein
MSDGIASTNVKEQQHIFMRMAIAEARKSPPKPTNFCVGALLVDEATDEVLATGFTLELPGNTHAEQCCFQKFATQHNVTESEIGVLLPSTTALYTTMEPCIERLSGNLPCLDRILRLRRGGEYTIKKVYTGVKEPSTFVSKNNSTTRLAQAGIEQIHITGYEEEITQIATSGHEKRQI